MRAALLAMTATVATLSCAFGSLPANAQDYRSYPWCAYFGNGRESCYYATFEQCRLAISGGGGMCSQNPWYTGSSGGTQARRSRSGRRR